MPHQELADPNRKDTDRDNYARLMRLRLRCWNPRIFYQDVATELTSHPNFHEMARKMVNRTSYAKRDTTMYSEQTSIQEKF